MLSSLLVVFVQLVFTCGAGWLLWSAWKHLSAINARAGLLIGAGIIIRALLAQAMFWVSYLHLPIARSLQDGDGFWKLAVDGRVYFGYANELLAHGWTAVALVDKTLPSPAFIQILAVFQLLFGAAVSIGALLNLFAYVGACAAILRLGRATEGQLATPALIALSALSFAPAAIIWSVQPLKDSFFIFAVIAFVVACTLWQEAWLARFSIVCFILPLLLMLVVMYAVAGIRWYFGLLLWGASIPYFVASGWRSRRRVIAVVTNTLIFFAFSQVIVFAARPYLPNQMIFPFRNAGHDQRSSLVAIVMAYRQNFEKSGGNTMIASGAALQRVDFNKTSAEAGSTASRPASRKDYNDTGASSQATIPTANGVPEAGAPPRPAATRIIRPVAVPMLQSRNPVTETAIARTAAAAAVQRVRPRAAVPVKTVVFPQSSFARVTAGLTAVVLPHFIGERLDLIHIGGGRGLWAIVETDTLVFDGVLLLTLYYIVRTLPQGAWRNPSFWLVVTTTSGITILLAYTISNFGTLFRHRAMIFAGLCLMLVVARATPPAPIREDVIGD